MKKLLLLLMMPILGYGQIIATVDETSKKVILNSDGTWKYQGQVDNNEVEGTGIWSIKYFVDDFGDPTDQGYIASQYWKDVKGTFSNSATSNSDLNVFILIRSSSDISVQLYEYAGNNPVKAYSTDDYSISVKDSNGIKHSMTGRIFEGGDRVYFDPDSNKNHISKMHNILMNQGEVSVVITKSEYGLSTYKFKFNADGYKNAFNNLLGN
tara:strand:- start:93 stop:722 length:630 start_codon:yes stop_codon:yes gene_type:complete